MASRLKKLKERHQEIKRLTAAGRTTAEVAELLDMHPESVRQIRRSPVFVRELGIHERGIDEKIAERVAERIVDDPVLKALQGSKVRAVNKVIDLMDGAESQKLQSDNAWEILNRTGYRPKEEGAGAATQIIIPVNQMLVLNQALEEVEG